MDEHTSLFNSMVSGEEKSFLKLTLGFQKYINLPGPNDIKLFTAVIYKFSYKARVFLLGKPFKIRLIFMAKARSLP